MLSCSYELVVIGGGPAGLAAAIEAKKNGVEKILVVERDRELGGILQQCIHNGFGLHEFKEDLTGPEYAERFIDGLMAQNIEYKLNTMVLDLAIDKTIRAINAESGLMKIRAKAIILAMGCREKTRGAIAIPGYRPAGVFTAGAAQRFINMEGYMVGEKVVILGSGDIGLIMARRLTLEGAKVDAVVEIMPFSSGLTRNIVQCLDDYEIPLLLSHTIVDIAGKDRVEGVTVAKVDENRKPLPGTEKFYQCDTLLLSVGLIPENELSRKIGIEMDPATGGPIVNEAMETTVEGVFGCGNVVHVHDLVDFVTQESMKAGKSAARYIKGDLSKSQATINTIPGEGVSYIVPHKVRIENVEKTLELFMRVKDVYHKPKLVVEVDGKIIMKFEKKQLTPGEMEKISIPADSLKGKSYLTIKIDVETKERWE